MILSDDWMTILDRSKNCNILYVRFPLLGLMKKSRTKLLQKLFSSQSNLMDKCLERKNVLQCFQGMENGQMCHVVKDIPPSAKNGVCMRFHWFNNSDFQTVHLIICLITTKSKQIKELKHVLIVVWLFKTFKYRIDLLFGIAFVNINDNIYI